jgi:hypothetical protein
MKKVLPVFCIFISLFTALLAVFFFNRSYKFKDGTDYYIIYSDMLLKAGGLIGVDSDGNITGRRPLKIQDIEMYYFTGNTFIAGGSRANNNLTLTGDGRLTQFAFLNNPHYTGVNAITTYKNNYVAVMNGNVEDKDYVNLLVIQDKKGKVLIKKVLHIFADDILCKDNYVYISGTEIITGDSKKSSKIIRFNISNSKLDEIETESGREYMKMCCKGDELYCLSRNYEGYTDRIDVFDMNSFNRKDTLIFDKDIRSLFTCKNELYGVLDNRVCKINSEKSIEEKCTLPDNAFIAETILRDGHVYFFSRYTDVKTEKGYRKVGYIIDYDILKDKMKKTPLSLKGGHLDMILFCPAADKT